MALMTCTKPAEQSQPAGVGFNVETLFTKDGCTVYRFYDDRNIYFTNCKGSTFSTHNCGKGCTALDSVSGGE